MSDMPKPSGAWFEALVDVMQMLMRRDDQRRDITAAEVAAPGGAARVVDEARAAVAEIEDLLDQIAALEDDMAEVSRQTQNEDDRIERITAALRSASRCVEAARRMLDADHPSILTDYDADITRISLEDL